MKIRAVIVEDEPPGRASLEYKLETYCEQVELVASYVNAASALIGIPQVKPDLVFLDIGLDTMSGLDIYKALNHLGFEAIFTTASRRHVDVRDAFLGGAVDYLSKPFTDEELIEAVERAQQRIENKTPKPSTSLLHIITTTKEHFIPIAKIIYCAAANNFTEIYVEGEERYILASETLGDLVDRLPTADFFRIHRSSCINRHHLKGINRRDGLRAIMSNRVELDIAKKNKTVFYHWMGLLHE